MRASQASWTKVKPALETPIRETESVDGTVAERLGSTPRIKFACSSEIGYFQTVGGHQYFHGAVMPGTWIADIDPFPFEVRPALNARILADNQMERFAVDQEHRV
jgi:hypothetical protein